MRGVDVGATKIPRTIAPVQGLPCIPHQRAITDNSLRRAPPRWGNTARAKITNRMERPTTMPNAGKGCRVYGSVAANGGVNSSG